VIAGKRYWVLIWVAFLVVGAVGLVASAYWGKRTGWRNLDEVLRALGTVLVSGGMILLLQQVAGALGTVLLVVALACFIGAFVTGRRID
jgi:hypothetical protein